MSTSFVEALEAHTKEDHIFQQETRAFNGEMAVFRAETEGSLAGLHEKLDLLLKKQQSIDNKFDPDSDDYFFTNLDTMTELLNGFGFSKRMLMSVAAIVGSIAVIIGGLFSAVRYIR